MLDKFRKLCGAARSLCDAWATCFDVFSPPFTPFRSFSLSSITPVQFISRDVIYADSTLVVAMRPFIKLLLDAYSYQETSK